MPKNSSTTALARTPSQSIFWGMNESPGSWASSRASSIFHLLFGFGRAADLDGVRAGDGDHYYLSTRWEGLGSGPGLVFHRPALEIQVDLARPGVVGRNAQVNRPDRADGPLDPGGPIGLHALDRLHHPIDAVHRSA